MLKTKGFGANPAFVASPSSPSVSTEGFNPGYKDDVMHDQLSSPLIGSYGGIQIIETETVGDAWEDWSKVRSPSRAIRRLKRGFKQRIITRYKANGSAFHDKVRNVIYMHPHDAIRLRAVIRSK